METAETPGHGDMGVFEQEDADALCEVQLPMMGEAGSAGASKRTTALTDCGT